jgi:small subunit ribosomal protein S18
MARKSTKEKDSKKKKKKVPKKKFCYFCTEHLVAVDYKDEDLLRRFMTERGKISPRRNTGTCALHQRLLAEAVKRGRAVAMLPYVREYFR